MSAMPSDGSEKFVFNKFRWAVAMACCYAMQTKKFNHETKTKHRNCFEFDANTHEVVSPATETNLSKMQCQKKTEFPKLILHFVMHTHKKMPIYACASALGHSILLLMKRNGAREHLWTNADIVCMRETCKWRNPNRLFSAECERFNAVHKTKLHFARNSN